MNLLPKVLYKQATPLGFNGANYGTQYQIAQSNGSGAANTWVDRSERDAGVSLVSSPLVTVKNIPFDTDALSWATKIDVYFSDVSCDDINGNLIIKPIDQTSNYFASGSLVGFAIGTVDKTQLSGLFQRNGLPTTAFNWIGGRLPVHVTEG